MKELIIFCFLVLNSYLREFYFTSYRSKSTHPIRLQDSLIINISERNAWISLIFIIEIFIKGRYNY